MRFTAMLIGEVVDELGTANDFIGHAGGDNFIIITTNEAAPALKQRLKDRFAAEVQTHYNFIDRQQGFIQATNAEGGMDKVPFMTLVIGMISPNEQSFADIREITELAAEARRQDAATATA
jgi:GGDEF domain-containing protein